MALRLSSSHVVPSRLDAIEPARRWLSEQAAAAGFAGATVQEVELALTEALSNVVRHAYGGRPDESIELFLTIDERALRLDVCDAGVPPFDPSTVAPPDLDNPSRGGYGLMLIDSLVDEVERDFRGGQGTRLSLIKHRTADTPVS
jgi:anti-sigma regulatory factor (Ser/Thr protein kinase)